MRTVKVTQFRGLKPVSVFSDHVAGQAYEDLMPGWLSGQIRVELTEDQDALVGAAIRELVEAPAWGADGYRLTLDVQSGEWEATVTGYTVAVGRAGKTAAEAADHCREALADRLPATSIGGHREP